MLGSRQWYWSYEYSDFVNDDGESIEFDVRPLIAFVLVEMSTMIGLISYKPINLPKVEMMRGREHVDKVSKKSSYSSLRGKVTFVYALITYLSQDSILNSKVTVTSF